MSYMYPNKYNERIVVQVVDVFMFGYALEKVFRPRTEQNEYSSTSQYTHIWLH